MTTQSIQDPEDLFDWHLLPLHLRHEPMPDDPGAVDDEGGRPRDVDRVQTEEPVDTVGLRDLSLLVDRHRVRDRMCVKIGSRGHRILAEDDHQAGAALLHARVPVSQLREPAAAGGSPGAAVELDDPRHGTHRPGRDSGGDPRQVEIRSG